MQGYLLDHLINKFRKRILGLVVGPAYFHLKPYIKYLTSGG